MRIWLPPSEGKTAPSSGPALDLDALVLPALRKARRDVISAVHTLGAGSEAAAVLGLGKKSSADAELNLSLETAPCAPAIDLFTGVLFDNLDARSLPPAARERLDTRTWISSGLFGFVRPGDPIPNHRLAMGTSLPGIGALAGWWRRQLTGVVPDLVGETIIDCRSGGYRAAYPATDADVVEIGVVEERSAGRKVITHMAKKWRGLAVRHLVESAVTDPLESLAALSARPEILDVEIAPAVPTRNGGSITRITLVTASTEA